jgi:Rrf2 family protein
VFSTTFHYGLICLLQLASSEGLLQAGAFASRQRPGPHYLAVVLTDLGKLGLVQSRKGKNGGHLLLADPNRINLLDLYRALAGAAEQTPLHPGLDAGFEPSDGAATTGDRPPSGSHVHTTSGPGAAAAAEAWLQTTRRRRCQDLAAASMADQLG